MKATEAIKRLQQSGWTLKNQKGGHAHYVHPTLPGKVTIPMHKGDIPKGTLRSIFRQAQLPWPP